MGIWWELIQSHVFQSMDDASPHKRGNTRLRIRIFQAWCQKNVIKIGDGKFWLTNWRSPVPLLRFFLKKYDTITFLRILCLEFRRIPRYVWLAWFAIRNPNCWKQMGGTNLRKIRVRGSPPIGHIIKDPESHNKTRSFQSGSLQQTGISSQVMTAPEGGHKEVVCDQPIGPT